MGSGVLLCHAMPVKRGGLAEPLDAGFYVALGVRTVTERAAHASACVRPYRTLTIRMRERTKPCRG